MKGTDMYLGEEYCSKVSGTVPFGGGKAKIILIRQRYSDQAVVNIEFQLLIPGCPTLSHTVFLANMNNDKQKARLLTIDDNNKQSILQELRAARKKIKDDIKFLIGNGNNVSTNRISCHIKEACLKPSKR